MLKQCLLLKKNTQKITVNDKGVEGNLQYESNLIQPIVNGDKEDQYCCL
ncbi:hypothetical protein LIS44_03500 [Acinetobacter haemolyticus]|nr:hypothetical protein [Acinetobacter kookii]UDM38837.1 hypothetical protein LIS44_03500 [Acinetobacter haemolyticus]